MSVQAHTVRIGTPASGVTVYQVAHGLLKFTWADVNVPREQAFEAIKAGIDSVPPGAKMLLNTADFYAKDLGTANLDLLADFFEKYPGYAEKTFLSVKGGVKLGTLHPDASPENLRRSVDTTIKHLRGLKKVDFFECARVDPNVPVEETVKTLAEFVKEGKVDYIGLSECSADTLKRAYAVYPIASVEIEISPWSYEEETEKVIATARELGVVIQAYSPIGQGFFSGKIKTRADLDPTDGRLRFERFSEENMQKNAKIVEEFTKIADRKGITPAQLSIAWVRSLGPHIIPVPGACHKSRVLENLASVNTTLNQDEVNEVLAILEKHPVNGLRYFGTKVNTFLWG